MKCADCKTSLQPQDACESVDLISGKVKKICFRCMNWYHYFAESLIGDCLFCGKRIDKKSAVYDKFNGFFCTEDCRKEFDSWIS